MTANQLAYLQYEEAQRANRAREAENERSNMAREAETERLNSANIAREDEKAWYQNRTEHERAGLIGAQADTETLKQAQQLKDATGSSFGYKEFLDAAERSGELNSVDRDIIDATNNFETAWSWFEKILPTKPISNVISTLFEGLG